MKTSAFSARFAVYLTIMSVSMGFLSTQLPTNARSHKTEQLSAKVAAENFEKASLDIGNTLTTQSKAWNEGDLGGFMSAYSKRTDTSYVSKDTQVYGFDAIEARYKKRYGNNRESMGTLSFSDLKYVDASPTSVICIGHWQVEKKDHEKISGVFSLIFVKEDSGWKILHDHTS